MSPDASIFVAGHRGLVGSALVRRLRGAGFHNLLLRERRDLDLTAQSAVAEFFAHQRPQYVLLAAARVGGILANNTYPADFLRENLAIQTNVIDSAWRNGVRKLLFLGSSCIYPRLAPQPMREECLLTGEDERPINVGWGRDQTIAELADTVARVVGFSGSTRYDASKPDGTPRKLLETSRLTELGWTPRTELAAGIRATYEWFLNNRSLLRT